MEIYCINSPDRILVKGGGRGRERDETDLAERLEVNDAIAEEPLALFDFSFWDVLSSPSLM
jgi:hypothetical protein